MPLSSLQFKSLSEIFGNISVAWFSAGIISPLFFSEGNAKFFMLYLILGISMSVVFGVISIYFSGKAGDD